MFKDWLHDWEWIFDKDNIPQFGKCKKCGAEKHWDTKRYRWSHATLNRIPVKFCGKSEANHEV